ncbi:MULTISPECIES: hypothetical protein [unclassified Chryseobacterium]|uniref:hypothetical protein n=1 Tax=unclassified Chryseobacterium TaxID=2593645 RepID=UPI0028532C61|nr:hypothetical protein [Chryseobacterium sp. CFS7]MDR4892299.1 hypothetical protein [Chryseobacterium sp. CFS7]
MTYKLNKLIVKKEKLLKELEVIYEQIALEKLMIDENVTLSKKKMTFEIQARNKFRIK